VVKLGFIGEGATEKKILESDNFRHLLSRLNLQYIPEVIDAKGSGKLLPHNIIPYTEILKDKGATHILILTDLDEDQCFTLTKERIAPLDIHTVTISVKKIEAWFLADTITSRVFFNDPSFYCQYPEDHTVPFDEIKKLRLEKIGKGTGDKKILARSFITCGFSVENAAQHENCNSAKYLIRKLQELS
jgi:hypothetical protein